jgi:hypothetical protein
MLADIKKVLERVEDLNSLKGKTDDLAVDFGSFRRDADKVNRRVKQEGVLQVYQKSYVFNWLFFLVVLLIILAVTLALHRLS